MTAATEIAAKMLYVKSYELRRSLVDDLDRVDELVHAAGGQLVSRQAVAVIIMEWERRNPDIDPWED